MTPQQQREYMRSWRQRHREQGLCLYCTRRPKRGSMCKPCRLRANRLARQRRVTRNWRRVIEAFLRAAMCHGIENQIINPARR